MVAPYSKSQFLKLTTIHPQNTNPKRPRMDKVTKKDIEEFRDEIVEAVVEDALQCVNNRCTVDTLQQHEYLMYHRLDTDLGRIEDEKWSLEVKYEKDDFADRRLRQLERDLQEDFYESEEWRTLARRFKRDLAEIVEKHAREVVAPRFASVMMDELSSENLENDYVKITKKN